MSSPKSAKKGGRPSKYTPEIQDAICSQIRRGLYEAEAARSSRIHPDTLIQWKKRYPEFAEALLKAKADGEADDMLVISEAAVNRYDNEGRLTRRGSWQAAAWRRERLQHDKYGIKWQGEVTGKGGKDLILPAPQIDISKYTEAHLDKLILATEIMLKNSKSVTSEANGHSNGNGNT